VHPKDKIKLIMDPIYSKATFISGVPQFSSQAKVNHVVDELTAIWIDDYRKSTPNTDIVETRSGKFYYLFDIQNERLIAAWGISNGADHDQRDKSRMAGHPMGVPSYHRGHVIPHQLGGGTDVNLVTQRGSLNVGAFRILERMAVSSPGALYFTYWLYKAPDESGKADQVPLKVDQGLLKPGMAPEIRRHDN